jgi:hypothetical protein
MSPKWCLVETDCWRAIRGIRSVTRRRVPFIIRRVLEVCALEPVLELRLERLRWNTHVFPYG